MKKFRVIIVFVCFIIALTVLLSILRVNRSLTDTSSKTRAHFVVRYTAEYDFAFITQRESLYTYPGENSVVCEVPPNTILTVLCMAVATDPATGTSTDYLCVYTPTQKVPGDDIGWIPCSSVVQYTSDMAGQVDCPVRVRENVAYYSSSDADAAEAQRLTREVMGAVYRREKGACEVAPKGSGDFIWVAESDVEPDLIDAATVFSSIFTE